MEEGEWKGREEKEEDKRRRRRKGGWGGGGEGRRLSLGAAPLGTSGQREARTEHPRIPRAQTQLPVAPTSPEAEGGSPAVCMLPPPDFPSQNTPDGEEEEAPATSPLGRWVARRGGNDGASTPRHCPALSPLLDAVAPHRAMGQAGFGSGSPKGARDPWPNFAEQGFCVSVFIPTADNGLEDEKGEKMETPNGSELCSGQSKGNLAQKANSTPQHQPR